MEHFRRLFAKKSPVFNSVPPTICLGKIIDLSTVYICISFNIYYLSKKITSKHNKLTYTNLIAHLTDFHIYDLYLHQIEMLVLLIFYILDGLNIKLVHL